LAIVDTGASVSCLSLNFARKCHIKVTKNNRPLFSADGRKLHVVGKANVYIGLGDLEISYNFYVVKKLNHPVLFGLDFLRRTGCQINLQKNCILFNNGLTSIPIQTFDSSMLLLKSAKHVTVPPLSEAIISTRLTNRAASRFNSENALIEPFVTAQQRGLCVARTLVKNSQTNQFACRVFNPWQKACKIPRNYIIATLSPIISEENICFLSQMEKSMQSERPMNAGRMQKVNNTQAGLQRARGCCGCSCECKQDRLARPAATAAWLDRNDRLSCDCREREKSTEQHTVASGEWSDGSSQQPFCSDSSNRQSSVAAARSAASKEVRRQDTLQPPLSHGQARLGQAQSATDSHVKGLTTLSGKVAYLQSKGFLVKNCDAVGEVYPQFIDLLLEFQDIFSYSATDITLCNLLECEFATYPDIKPIICRPYRLSDEMRGQVDKQLNDLLDAGVIVEDEDSSFASPVVLVRKRDSSYRFCVDFRNLNKICLPLYQPLPVCEDILDVMRRNQAQVLTTLDLKQAYHTIPISEKSSRLTTFVTPHRGSFRYKRLPQGFSQSPYFMQLALNKLFRNQIGSYLLIYLDDVICVSESSMTHLKHIRTIFQKFRDANLKLHPGKCNFFQSEVQYLSFIFSKDGVKSDPKKIAIVQNYPRPKRVKDVRAFLGLTNYFRRYIYNYADVCYPLYRLLKADVQFIWSDEAEHSFQALKKALCEAPVLALPDVSQEMILTTGASDKSICYNLSMIKDGKERIISYGGRGLRPAEKNYTVCEKELLGIISGVLHYHEYLQPKPFLIKTDNNALKYLESVKHITGRLGRWYMLLSGYKFRIEHVKGSKNIVADTLSRIDLLTLTDDTEELDEKVANINNISSVTVDEDPTVDDDLKHRSDCVWAISLDKPPSDNSDDDETVDTDANIDESLDSMLDSYDVQQLQQTCPDCQVFLQYFRSGILPPDDAGARKIVYQAKRFVLDDGLLYHLDLPRNRKKFAGEPVSQQLMVPQSLRKLLLRFYHENLSHIGSEKMYTTLREKYYWQNMYVDVQNWTKSCIQCQTGKTGAVHKAPLKPLSPPVSVFDTWHIDHVALPRSKDYQYALVLVDSLSLFSLILPTKTCGADETARLLFDHLFMMFGARTLISDRGSAFKSRLLKALCALLGTKQRFTSSRHPQTNSRAESFNKNILNSLRTKCNSEKEWPQMLSAIAFSFRTSVVKSLGVTPYELVFGLKPRLPVDNLLLPPNNLPKSARVYFEKMRPQLEILRENVRQNQLQSHLDTKRFHDAKTTVRPSTFKVADRVWLREATPSKVKLGHKVQKKFIGPFLVLEAYPDFCTFKLQNSATQKILPSLIHSDRLKLCDSGRDELFSKYNDVTDTVTDTPETENDDVMDSTRSSADKGKTVDNSRTTSLRTNGSTAFLPQCRPTTENATASDTESKQADKRSKRPVRIFTRTRTTRRAENADAESDIAANASTAAATAATNKSPGVEERHASHALTMPAQAQSANTDGQNGNSVGGFLDWYEIKCILAHRKRGLSIFYKILWHDDSISWVPERDVTNVATDKYWLSRYEQGKIKKKRRQRSRRQ